MPVMLAGIDFNVMAWLSVWEYEKMRHVIAHVVVVVLHGLCLQTLSLTAGVAYIRVFIFC